MNAFGSKRARLGMTFSEVLVTLLIFSLVTVAVAAGVSAAVRSYDRSVSSSEAQTLCSTLSQAVMDILHSSHDASDSADAPTVSSELYGEDVSFSSGGGRIYFGGKSILGSGAYTDLGADIACSCSQSVFTVTITVTGSGGGVLTEETFSVRVPD